MTYYDDTSDIRLKTVIEPIKGASASLREMRSFRYRFNDLAKEVMGHNTETVHIGMSAQEVQAHYPEATRTKDSGYLKLWYEDLIPVLAAAHNEHSAILETQEQKIERLENRVLELENFLNL